MRDTTFLRNKSRREQDAKLETQQDGNKGIAKLEQELKIGDPMRTPITDMSY